MAGEGKTSPPAARRHDFIGKSFTTSPNGPSLPVPTSSSQPLWFRYDGSPIRYKAKFKAKYGYTRVPVNWVGL